MQTKKGAGGLQQPYVPAGNGDESGEYRSFDSSILDNNLRKACNILGYEKVAKYVYESHKPPLISTSHFEKRLKERGLTNIVVAEAIAKPIYVSQTKYDTLGRPSITYYGPNVTVSINPNNGHIITVHKTRKNIRNKMKEKKYVSR